MESVAYILIFTLCIGVIFFAIAFREPPRLEKKEDKQVAIPRFLRVQKHDYPLLPNYGGSGYYNLCTLLIVIGFRQRYTKPA